MSLGKVYSVWRDLFSLSVDLDTIGLLSHLQGAPNRTGNSNFWKLKVCTCTYTYILSLSSNHRLLFNISDISAVSLTRSLGQPPETDPRL